MNAKVLALVQRENAAAGGPSGRAELRDVYDLDSMELSSYTGVVVSGHCDQRFLCKQREVLERWVVEGGRLLINGHPHLGFLSELPRTRKLEFHTQSELALAEVEPHPIWSGIDRRDVLFKTGVPGVHSFEELKRIGVAGFYAHAYLVGLPRGTRVITGIGAHRLPVDVSYPLGSGEVIVHCGNDLAVFAHRGTTAERLPEQVMCYLEGR
ncbi:hypothetical protein [Leucobacter luti]|uniref:hypothetical protein n=1 Tax=Leucobacter luti TaxID=340320 RepID=UPI003D08525E